MFSIPGVIGLVLFTFIRPQAFIPALAEIPLIYILYAATLIGLALDLRLRIIRPRLTPMMWWGLAYLGWAALSLVVRKPGAMSTAAPYLLISFALFFVTAHAVHSFRAFRTVVVLLVGASMFLSLCGIYQGLADKGCVAFKSSPAGVPDGRPCDTWVDCLDDPEPGANYGCEHIGLFGTYSVNERVRWLGIIQDPNELSMCIALCIPLLIGLYQHRPSRKAAVVLVLCGAAITLCTVFTQSRGGQLVFISAVGVYFIRRYGVRGAIACGIAALPILLLGGRSGEEADLSKMERIEALYVAMTLMVQYPVSGVGFTQFGEMHTLTAHNSYALSAAEMGLPGLYLFVLLMYLPMKTFILAAKRYPADGPSRVANVWAGSLIAAQCGLMVGIFLLSFIVQPILWIFLGVCGGFYLAVKRHDPMFSVRLRLLDFVSIGAISAALAVLMFIYSRYKMAGVGG